MDKRPLLDAINIIKYLLNDKQEDKKPFSLNEKPYTLKDQGLDLNSFMYMPNVLDPDVINDDVPYLDRLRQELCVGRDKKYAELKHEVTLTRVDVSSYNHVLQDYGALMTLNGLIKRIDEFIGPKSLIEEE